MRYKVNKAIAYVLSAGCIALMFYWVLTRGFGAIAILLFLAAVLSYEYTDYVDFARQRAAWNARPTEACRHCKSTGKIGRRRCPECGGRGFIVAPKDRFRPPIT
jgi:hypothetical protein